MSSASKRSAPIGVGRLKLNGDRSGLMYAVRMIAGPDDFVSWRTPAGIHSARVGGSTQVSAAHSTVSTPSDAHAS